jgi:hypothetical protein
MAGRLGHIEQTRRVGHVPVNGIRKTNYAYGFGGVNFWLDAGYGLNTQTDLAAVTKWIDRIRGISFQQSTAASQPRFILSDANFNNYPTVDFSVSTSRYLQSFYSYGFPNTTDFTIAFIAKYGVLNTQNCVAGTSVAGAPRIALGGTAASWNGVTVFNTSLIGSGTTESTSTKIAIITNTEIVVNGTQEATYSYFNFNLNMDQIGIANTLGGQQLRGQIAEIIVFGDALSSADCIRLSDNINAKYAIY